MDNQEIIDNFVTQAKFGNLDKVKELLDEGVDINSKSKRGRTALMMASRFGKEDVVEFLLKKKANPNLRDNEGMTALMLAIEGHSMECVDVLLRSKVNLNIKDKCGLDAILFAIRTGQADVVSKLIDNGVKVKRSLFDEAENCGRTEIFLLLEAKKREVRKQEKMEKILANKEKYKKDCAEKNEAKRTTTSQIKNGMDFDR